MEGSSETNQQGGKPSPDATGKAQFLENCKKAIDKNQEIEEARKQSLERAEKVKAKRLTGYQKFLAKRREDNRDAVRLHKEKVRYLDSDEDC